MSQLSEVSSSTDSDRSKHNKAQNAGEPSSPSHKRSSNDQTTVRSAKSRRFEQHQTSTHDSRDMYGHNLDLSKACCKDIVSERRPEAQPPALAWCGLLSEARHAVDIALEKQPENPVHGVDINQERGGTSNKKGIRDSVSGSHVGSAFPDLHY